VSRTNHHRRNYKRWNIVGMQIDHYRGVFFREYRNGMETYDLRFYAGCRRTPQPVHRVLDFHGRYPWRFHYGSDGVAKSYADIAEGELRAAVRIYTGEALKLLRAGEDLDELLEPDLKPRSIEYELW